jgi:hypothetical protein
VTDAAGGDLYANLTGFGRVEIDLFDPPRCIHLI